MKKLIALLLALALMCSLVACGGKGAEETNAPAPTEKVAENDVEEAPVAAAGKHIIVLTPTEATGWTGSVATFAKESIAAINAEGKFTAELLTAADGNEQNNQLEDIAANNKAEDVAVVILPFDDTVERGLNAIINAGIEYAAFDRLITSVADKAVSNVKGDNEAVGAAIAYYLTENGMKPGDKCLTFEGDTSSVTTARTAGFYGYLKGEKEFNGSKIATAWTDDDTKAIISSGSLSWSQTQAQTWFETLMGDAGNADVKYLAAFDDSFIIGVMDALQGSAISGDIKATFYAGKPVISGCGGAENVYSIIRGESYQDIAANFGGIMSATYSSSMIQDTIQMMVEHLSGNAVEQDYVIATEIVDASNVTNFVGFN